MPSSNDYLLVPFTGLQKISTHIMREIPFDEWYETCLNIEHLIKVREYEYKDGIKMAKITKQELLTLQNKYEKADEII